MGLGGSGVGGSVFLPNEDSYINSRSTARQAAASNIKENESNVSDQGFWVSGVDGGSGGSVVPIFPLEGPIYELPICGPAGRC